MENPRFAELRAIAKNLGLDFFDTIFETVPMDIMNEIAAYGLPTRPQHWSYGRVWSRQKMHGDMGLSKIYEIVLNNNPGYAFLLDTNTDVANLLVVAHVYAHVDFFKNNMYFKSTDRNMMNVAVEHAIRVDTYIERYGLDRVEHLMDIAFALDRHIDFHQGLARIRYSEREVIEKEHKFQEYNDLFPGQELSMQQVVVGDKLPPYPEKDFLWFLAEYAPLDPWERDVFLMLRAESYYFYPQFGTKILNEGWATYWHAEILNQYEKLTPAETIDFAVLHAGIVNPGHRMSLNPYYLGYKILSHTEKRFDKLHKEGKSALTGRQKLFEIRAQENDISFIRNYLTQELVDDLELFAYGYACGHMPPTDAARKKCPKCGDVIIDSRRVDDVINGLTLSRYNYGAPILSISKVDREGDGTLILEHNKGDISTLDSKYAEETLKYLQEIWKKPVLLNTYNEEGAAFQFKKTTTSFSSGSPTVKTG